MKCYQHQQSDAVAICACCGKGCCTDCVISADPVITCSEVCKVTIEENRQILQRTKMIYGIGEYQGNKVINMQVLLFTIMGALFFGFGVYQTAKRGSDSGLFLLVLGAAFMLLGGLAWYRNRKIKLNC